MDCVINRHGSVSSSLLIRTEIDDIHRRIRDKGTFDRDDLEAILAHYWTIDPEGIFSNAEEITELRERLDAVGRFENLVPQPNSDALDDTDSAPQGEEEPLTGEPPVEDPAHQTDETDDASGNALESADDERA